MILYSPTLFLIVPQHVQAYHVKISMGDLRGKDYLWRGRSSLWTQSLIRFNIFFYSGCLGNSLKLHALSTNLLVNLYSSRAFFFTWRYTDYCPYCESGTPYQRSLVLASPSPTNQALQGDDSNITNVYQVSMLTDWPTLSILPIALIGLAYSWCQYRLRRDKGQNPCSNGKQWPFLATLYLLAFMAQSRARA